MAVCGSRTSHTGHFVGNMAARRLHYCMSGNNSTVSYSNRSIENVRKANISLRNKCQPGNFMLSQYFRTSVAKMTSQGFRILSPARFSFGTTSPGLSGDNSKEQAANTVDSSKGKIRLELNSGSFYLPHPAKAKTGGEDAHFICGPAQAIAIGVADGVGGWADHGIDAGEYARELMSNSISAIQEEPKDSIDLMRVLEKAHMRTKARGSSTACIIALTDEGLYAVNLGDSRFMLVRHGSAIFESPVQQHGFNFPYQLGGSSAGDLPSLADVFKVTVAPGDVLVAGTDGLFDNLYDADIMGVVIHAVEDGLGPQMTAQKIAALAQQRAMDPIKPSPFSDAAKEAGFEYPGGKLDDITVVVSYITSNANP
ncbi:probable protein phosphatase 2C 55 isoform X1 [Lycium ferocissimum]|uniref:probable protein phosphatase 2C 55 isoform X1 n=1 Tax=Lycium ferocissimum TaxID=112874 RepID=UPI0028150B91|nr:probable protein phosphatase 2C 55 isoform X1 [Lycium ferocissimum]XP_059277262.1 probable protein phosphatase 2C 55 isoform X1 [Lycium ferocissimum]XP_059277263.1 probable protein phosphatase 2C 55 isoform X1 [Lycium ferocissimum]XP_059277264.1 probable protein phosphatase 2C 55 isoform X1 [Lycium ferocissimum]